MRNPTLRFVVLLLIIGFSCQVSGLCIPACQNGGSCVSDVCQCVTGYGGASCDDVVPTTTTTPPPTTTTSTTTTTTTTKPPKKGHC
ncbi:latent-transforming growth factor beta-binding protein 2-like [Mizuhopecten yessoensis]|uniref:latent-transforming growth factor beta-binding protein 2-like n=1 Tax=Mizuhopecten yessoensis TaxID=6573 RepID=UPI000B45EB43|nr:latent-transforming growth factor beta-binding protein 2-like [Mizuhopecten yessoensis]